MKRYGSWFFDPFMFLPKELDKRDKMDYYNQIHKYTNIFTSISLWIGSLIIGYNILHFSKHNILSSSSKQKRQVSYFLFLF